MAPYTNSLSGLSPLQIDTLLSARDTSTTTYIPGKGTVAPTSINNNAVFALFGLLGAGFVISSIWFFFWAKNGGFRWRKQDWSDYKTTVLRRKGPNGTILSGATKSTKLGDGSIVGSLGSMDDGEYKDLEKGTTKKARGKQVKNSQDKDVRAYRHEKPAKVGGLNREADGTTATDPSATASVSAGIPRRSGAQRNSRHIPTYPQSESGFSGTASVVSDNSQRPLRSDRRRERESYRYEETPPAPPSHTSHQRPIRQVQPSGRYQHSSRQSTHGGYTEPLDFNSRYGGSVDGSLESEQVRNTKAYFHPIPGLSRGT